LKSWASAWSAQDVKKYLSYYAATFRPYKGSVSAWRKQRELRLKRPAYIKVDLRNIEVNEISDTKAKVFITQSYASDSFRDSTRKLFRLIKQDGDWKIYRESVVSQ